MPRPCDAPCLTSTSLPTPGISKPLLKMPEWLVAIVPWKTGRRVASVSLRQFSTKRSRTAGYRGAGRSFTGPRHKASSARVMLSPCCCLKSAWILSNRGHEPCCSSVGALRRPEQEEVAAKPSTRAARMSSSAAAAAALATAFIHRRAPALCAGSCSSAGNLARNNAERFHAASGTRARCALALACRTSEAVQGRLRLRRRALGKGARNAASGAGRADVDTSSPSVPASLLPPVAVLPAALPHTAVAAAARSAAAAPVFAASSRPSSSAANAAGGPKGRAARASSAVEASSSSAITSAKAQTIVMPAMSVANGLVACLWYSRTVSGFRRCSLNARWALRLARARSSS
mmetsp:Transcript_95406/g.274762  ORF Transcript_95406/g.274762 Transcript_95406/m.274762 type:complete len:347 (-) Transcript_95406:250-1290(-)